MEEKDITNITDADKKENLLEETPVVEDIETENEDIDFSSRKVVEEKDIDYKALLKKRWFTRFCKRSFDIFASGLGLLFMLPIFLVVAIIIKCTSKGPVFFRQVRVGKNGKPFRIFKFRTMVVDAEAKGMQITIGADSRITKIGKILRKTKLDEFPQLINVFIGDMSLVGPRPEVPHYVDMYSDYEKNVLLIRPGITELSSIIYCNENDVLASAKNPEWTYINEIMPTKLEINLEYITKMNLFYDIGLIFKTFLAILKWGRYGKIFIFNINI